MSMMRVSVGFSIALFSFGFPESAQAYVDPGSGSILLQLILGGVAGAAVVMKLYWQRFKDATSGLFRKRQ